MSYHGQLQSPSLHLQGRPVTVFTETLPIGVIFTGTFHGCVSIISIKQNTMQRYRRFIYHSARILILFVKSAFEETHFMKSHAAATPTATPTVRHRQCQWTSRLCRGCGCKRVIIITTTLRSRAFYIEMYWKKVVSKKIVQCQKSPMHIALTLN